MRRLFPLAVALAELAACSNSGSVLKDLVEEGGAWISPDWSGSARADADSFYVGDGAGWEEYVPNPGEFGAPCTKNSDCESGYCIEGLNGYICTKLCMEECPSGYECVGVNIGSDVVFICVPRLDRSCERCSSDLQCAGGRCVEFDEGKYCLAPCLEGECKETYSCQDVQVAGGTEKLCMPMSGTCECGPESLNQEKACKQYGGTGVCYGVQFCTETGWSPCKLPDEICDGKDNDCNGVVDDGFFNPVTGTYDTDEHCGVCNNSCKGMSAPHAFGECSKTGPVPVCVWKCEDGFFDVNNNPTDGCECKYLSSQDDPDVAGDANCDGINGVIEDGVFVAKNGSDGNPGTVEQPVLTVQQGIDLAESLGKPNVYVATGVYVESVLLKAGVSIYGGYSADFKDRSPDLNQTVIMGLPFTPDAPGAVNCLELAGIPTTVSGFHIFGEDAMEMGGSSYAVYVRDCDSAVHFTGNVVIAGNGRDGKDGEDGLDGEMGVDGTEGEGAYDINKEVCTVADWTHPGLGGKKECQGIPVDGGDGGWGICPDYDESGEQPKSLPYDQSHKAAEWGKDGSGVAPGKGGEPGYDGLLWSKYQNCGVCNVPKSPDGSKFLPSLGQSGENGADGTDGFGAGGCIEQFGKLDGWLWSGVSGNGGGDGTNGSGGGGGGAGGGVETLGCSDKPLVKYTDIGGSGGGGGSGGCAGTGGGGGGAGGGSFGFFITGDPLAASLPMLSNNVIQTGFGGNGGDGGAGGVGGTGGKGKGGGGSGEGQGSAWCADAGGHGGNGGRGGHGGGGGGGCGGPSFGIFLIGPNPGLAQDYLTANEFILAAAPGNGGSGGKSMGNPGSAGLPGAGGKTNF